MHFRFDAIRTEAHAILKAIIRQPRFATAYVVMLTVGVGLATAGYSILDRLVLSPFPFADGDRLGVVWMRAGRTGIAVAPDGETVSAWIARSRSVDMWGVMGTNRYYVGDSSGAIVAAGQDVSPQFLASLGARVVAGRSLVGADTLPGAPRVALIGEALWHRAFGGSKEIVGRTIALNDTLVTVVGVAPQEWNALVSYRPVDIWTPIAFHNSLSTNRSAFSIYVVARRRPHTSNSAVQAELQSIYRESVTRRGGRQPDAERQVLMGRTSDLYAGDFTIALWAAFGGSLLVLAIACANAMGLQILRNEDQLRDISIREALGATRTRLLGHAIAEASILSVVGAAGSVVFARLVVTAVAILSPPQVQQLSALRLDHSAMAFACGVSMICGCAVVVIAHLATIREKGRQGQTLGARRTMASARFRVHRVVVGAEMAIAVVVLTVNALLLRSYLELQRADPGHAVNGLMEVRLVLRATRYPDTASRTQLWERLIERLQRIPDIASWTISMALPSDRGLSEVIGLQIEGRDLPSDATHVWLSDHIVTSEYFRVVQPRVVRGRLFSADDDLGGTDAVVIAAHVEKTLWRGASALGKASPVRHQRLLAHRRRRDRRPRGSERGRFQRA